MTVYEIDPLRDPRWSEFLDRHPRASVFHTVAWLSALRRTYGYDPVGYTTSAPHHNLDNALVFCQVRSWLTGRRLVSLPFSDHCDLLLNNSEDLYELTSALKRRFTTAKWRYIEFRPLRAVNDGTIPFEQTCSYYFHRIDLTLALDTIFQKFHKDSTQRKIVRADREGVSEEQGVSDSLLDQFYRLQVITRRRHGFPPQPRNWFRNLVDCFGHSANIRVASKDGQPLAAILTLTHKDTLVYKYGCSDARLSRFGGTHLLFWRSIQEAKRQGLRVFDLGRSDCDQSGLVTFKDRWGAQRTSINYLRYPALAAQSPSPNWKRQVAKRFSAHAPDSLFCAMGNLLYKHLA